MAHHQSMLKLQNFKCKRRRNLGAHEPDIVLWKPDLFYPSMFLFTAWIQKEERTPTSKSLRCTRFQRFRMPCGSSAFQDLFFGGERSLGTLSAFCMPRPGTPPLQKTHEVGGRCSAMPLPPHSATRDDLVQNFPEKPSYQNSIRLPKS